MSVKLPGIGQKVSSYKYVVTRDSQNDIFVSVIFCKLDKYNNSVKQQKTFEIRKDTRWANEENIIQAIEKHLQDGLSGKLVKVREDKNRMYVFFNNDKFTGNSI